MRNTLRFTCVTVILLIAAGGTPWQLAASADSDPDDSFSNFTLLGTIQVPNNPTTNPANKLQFFDISFVDSRNQRYYLADRSNAGVDIFDAANNVFLHRVGGFVGEAFHNGQPDNDHSGPNGVLVIQPQNELWAGDGDSTVKVIDLRTNQIIDIISTGGTARADEMAYDPGDRVLAVANNADDPAFISLILTEHPRHVLSRITFDAALAATFGAEAFPGGIEQSVWNPHNRRFYVSIPSVQFATVTKGAIAVIDPRVSKVTNLFTFDDCGPAGLAIGPHEQLLIGCSDPSRSLVMDPSGDIVKTFSSATGDAIGGSDEVWFNPGDTHYYLAARNNPGGPVLGIIDADTNTLTKTVPTSPNSHSVAANAVNNHVFVPLTGTRPTPCPAGCIGVYGRPDTDNDGD
ncbi:MAG: cytochrome C nitrite reductase [Candidatus Rokuibacteriota bacterium]|nr:MAG: cytochrome C nitrite reductase [Candidatus Rokubacteria bacterium]